MIFKVSDYFPLKPIRFEGIELMGPNRPEECMKCLFGENYMGFPGSGVMHHSDDTSNIANWAADHGIDMQQMKRELEEILGKIRKDME